MAIDNRLQVFNEEGQSVDYDILASDVKFSDGKDLPTKLGELEEEIGSGGYTPPQGGIPATDLAPAVQTSLGKADTAYQKPASGIPASDLATGVIPDISGLADKSEMSVAPGTGSNADKTTITLKQGTSATVLTQHQDVSNLATKSEVSQKANAADVYTKAQVDQAIEDAVDDIPAGQDGITPHIGSNGHWWIGDENDSENDTGVTAQGPAGTSYTSADLAIGNALNGQGDVLGMQGAMQMKANIDSLFTSLSRLYTKLGNMAFWSSADKTAAAPTALDWQVPQVTVTLDKTALSANAMITNANEQEITGTSISVDQGSGLTLKIKPRPNCVITAASATIGGVSQTLTESGGIYTLAVASVTSAITIVFNVTAAAAIPITIGTLTHCVEPSGVNPDGVLSGQSTNIVLEVDSGYELTNSGITISGATVGTITHSGNVYTIPITHDGTSQSISFSATASVVTMKFLHHYFIHPNDGMIYYNFGGETSTYTADRVILSEYVKLPSYDGALKDTVVTYNQQRGNVEPWPSSLIFYKYENGAFTQILTFGWNNNSSSRTVTRAHILSNEYITDRQQIVADIEAALASGTCYIRFCLYLNAAKDGLQPNTNTGVNNAGVTYNGSVIFNKDTPYTVLEAADWTVDDLSEVVTS